MGIILKHSRMIIFTICVYNAVEFTILHDQSFKGSESCNALKKACMERSTVHGQLFQVGKIMQLCYWNRALTLLKWSYIWQIMRKNNGNWHKLAYLLRVLIIFPLKLLLLRSSLFKYGNDPNDCNRVLPSWMLTFHKPMYCKFLRPTLLLSVNGKI